MSSTTLHGWEVRWHPDAGESQTHPDEVVGTGLVHVERLDDNCVWMGLGPGADVHVTFYADHRWPARIEVAGGRVHAGEGMTIACGVTATTKVHRASAKITCRRCRAVVAKAGPVLRMRVEG